MAKKATKKPVKKKAAKKKASAKRKTSKKSAAKKKIGRPTVMTKKTLRLIMGALRLNVTIEDAAAFAKVSARTLYRHIEENEDFCQEYEQARVQGKIHSLSLITASRSTRDHQWLLEKQHRKEYGKQVVDVNIGGQPENPVVFDFTGMSVDDVLEVIKATEPDQSEENK